MANKLGLNWPRQLLKRIIDIGDDGVDLVLHGTRHSAHHSNQYQSHHSRDQGIFNGGRASGIKEKFLEHRDLLGNS